MMPHGDDQHYHVRTTIPLYVEITVHLVITNSLTEAHTALKVPIRSDCCDKSSSGGECHMDDESYDVYVFISKSHLTHGWISHEFHHAVNCIAGKVGLVPDRSNDETDARIAEFLNSWAYRQLDKAGLQVTHHPHKVS